MDPGGHTPDRTSAQRDLIVCEGGATIEVRIEEVEAHRVGRRGCHIHNPPIDLLTVHSDGGDAEL